MLLCWVMRPRGVQLRILAMLCIGSASFAVLQNICNEISRNDNCIAETLIIFAKLFDI